MANKIWIDDLRDPPTDDWHICRTSSEAIDLLTRWETLGMLLPDPAPLDEISFDHDLGGDDTTRRVMYWLVEHNVWARRVVIHTANPVGRDYLLGMARRYAPDWVEVI